MLINYRRVFLKIIGPDFLIPNSDMGKRPYRLHCCTFFHCAFQSFPFFGLHPCRCLGSMSWVLLLWRWYLRRTGCVCVEWFGKIILKIWLFSCSTYTSYERNKPLCVWWFASGGVRTKWKLKWSRIECIEICNKWWGTRRGSSGNHFWWRKKIRTWYKIFLRSMESRGLEV